MADDYTPQLLGRGLRPALRQSPTRGPRHLWDHSPGVASQASIVVYTDGTVVEGYDFEAWEMAGPDVLAFIMGGSDFRYEAGPICDALIAAGYTFGFGITMDVYTNEYTETYPLLEGTP